MRHRQSYQDVLARIVCGVAGIMRACDSAYAASSAKKTVPRSIIASKARPRTDSSLAVAPVAVVPEMIHILRCGNSKVLSRASVILEELGAPIAPRGSGSATCTAGNLVPCSHSGGACLGSYGGVFGRSGSSRDS